MDITSDLMSFRRLFTFFYKTQENNKWYEKKYNS